MRTIALTTTHRREELREATFVADSFEAIALEDWIN
jgi:hypothetical protein